MRRGTSRMVLLLGLLLSGILSCAEISPPIRNTGITLREIPASCLIEGVPWYRQGSFQCGPTSLAMVLNYYGAGVSKEDIIKWVMNAKASGTAVSQIEYYARTIQGFNVYRLYDRSADKSRIKFFLAQGYPLIAIGYVPSGWHFKGTGGHFVVVVGYDAGNFVIQDPAWGKAGRERTKVPYPVFSDFLLHPSFPHMVLCVYPPLLMPGMDHHSTREPE